MRKLLQVLGGSCGETAERLSDYTDGELGRLRRARLQLHLAMCSACRAVLASLRTTLDELRRLGHAEAEPSPQLAKTVVERIRRGKRA
jgi:anti-sigma factor RsiW